MSSILRRGGVVLASLFLAVGLEPAVGAKTYEIDLQRPEKAGSLFRIQGSDERTKVTRIRSGGELRDESEDVQSTEISMVVQVIEVNSFGEISRAMIAVEKLIRGGQQILAQGQLTQVRGRSVRQHIVSGDAIARSDQGTLVNAGILVRARVLGQVIDIDAWLGRARFLIVDAHDDA